MTEELVEGLVTVDPNGPGWTRHRRGRGFSYHDEQGRVIRDPEVLARLRELAVPPAWRDVWLSPDPDGHIQAVGTDDAGRRQYRYHEDWRVARDAAKHERALRLGARLPRIRSVLRERLDQPGLGRDRVLAAAVRMLDLGVFRSGNEEYAPSGSAEVEGSFGLATLQREHVRLRRGAVEFAYVAKGGTARTLVLADPVLHKVIRSLLRRDGGIPDLLAYRNGRRWHDVRADDLNAAVKELAGPTVTCKDLRTWSATVVAAVRLAAAARDGVPERPRARARLVTAVMEEVSDHLGNTPAVAKASYVDPRVVTRFEEGRTVLPTLRRLGGVPELADLIRDDVRDRLDRAVVRLVRGH